MAVKNLTFCWPFDMEDVRKEQFCRQNKNAFELNPLPVICSDRRFGTDSTVDSVDPEIAQYSKLFVRAQHHIRCSSGRRKTYKKRASTIEFLSGVLMNR